MDFIIVDQDTINFLPIFGIAVVVPQPGTITATGTSSFKGKKVCIQGDEASVMVPGCTYMTPSYPIPGVGTIIVERLNNDQLAQKTKSNQKPMILKGSQLNAKFIVQTPAQQPTIAGPIPDPLLEYSGGMGSFINSNTKYRGT